MKRVLSGLGYEAISTNGSHCKLAAEGRPQLTFAFHDGVSLAPGVVRDILVKQVGLDIDEARWCGEMPEIIHLFVRREADGLLYVTSPQAPGLMYGESTIEAVRGGIQDVLVFHFGRPGPYPVVEHHEHHHEAGDGELVTRLAIDRHLVERQVVQDRIRAALKVPEQASGLLAAPTNRVGETTYVCAVATDTLGWLGDQLDPYGSDSIMIAAAVSDALVFAVAFVRDEGDAGRDDVIQAKPEMTVADVVRRTAIVGPAPVAHPMIRVPA